jgi:hypothetical protein
MSGVAGVRTGSAWQAPPTVPTASPTVLRVRLIGAMDARTGDGLSVLPRTRKARALLAILVLLAPQKIARATVAGLLWSRRGREQARGSLRQALLDLHGSLLSGGIDCRCRPSTWPPTCRRSAIRPPPGCWRICEAWTPPLIYGSPTASPRCRHGHRR